MAYRRNSDLVPRARQLRREMTPQEKHLKSSGSKTAMWKSISSAYAKPSTERSKIALLIRNRPETKPNPRAHFNPYIIGSHACGGAGAAAGRV